MTEQEQQPWLPRTPAEVGPPHEVTLTTLVTTYSDLRQAPLADPGR